MPNYMPIHLNTHQCKYNHYNQHHIHPKSLSYMTLRARQMKIQPSEVIIFSFLIHPVISHRAHRFLIVIRHIAKIYGIVLFPAKYAVLFVPILWRIAIEYLSVSFTFFGLIMLRTDLEKVEVQGFANLEKQVSIDPLVAKHLIQVLA